MTLPGWGDLASAAVVVGLVGGAVAALVRETWGAIRRRRRADALLRLAEIRTHGVALRNEGAYSITVPAEFPKWEARVDAWAERAGAVLDQLARHEAAIFRTIDRIDAEQDAIRDGQYLADASIGYGNGENWHARRVAMLASRTRELKAISERYSAATSI